MTPSSSALTLLRAPARLTRRRPRLTRSTVRLPDGAATTLHVATYDQSAFVPRIVTLTQPRQLGSWCREQGVRHALVGGFFKRPEYVPLGELRLGGRAMASHPFHDPWAAVRACVHVGADGVRIDRRDGLPAEPDGDLLQAGPLLVADGALAVGGGLDVEVFSAGADQFDSDISRGRYPRAALGLAGSRLLAVACDGRTDHDAGMTLEELGSVLIAMGAESALNLDGGGSTSLVHNGRLRNRPREEHGVDLLGGRPIVTAIAFAAR